MIYFPANTRRQIIQILQEKSQKWIFPVTLAAARRCKWIWDSFGPKLWVHLMDKAFFSFFFFLKRSPDWNTWWYLTIGNSCIHELSTPRPQNRRGKRCVAIRNATIITHLRNRKQSWVPQIHSRRESKALHLCIFRPYDLIFFFFLRVLHGVLGDKTFPDLNFLRIL